MPNTKTVIEAVKAFFKPVTTKFPETPPDHIPNGFKGKIILDKEKCIGCGACLSSCPSFAYEHIYSDDKSKKLMFYNPAACTFCERCVEFCLTEALSMSQNYDMTKVKGENSKELINELSVQLCKSCNLPVSTEKQLNWIQNRFDSAKIETEEKKVILIKEFIIAKEYCVNCRQSKQDELGLHKQILF